MSVYPQDWEIVMAMVSDETQEAASEDDFSDLEELFNNKLNINDLSDDDFSVFFFLTDFEQAILAYYVAHNRPLLSMYELQFVLGLPLQKAKLLSQFCYAAPMLKPKPIEQLLNEGRHVFASNTSLTNIKNEDYKGANNYQGGAQKEVVRYRFQSNNSLFCGVTLKKDKGEAFTLREGFDSKSMYVQVKNRGVLSNLVVGDYKVSIGQGLMFSQGFSMTSSLEESGGVQSFVLSKHSSTSEYLFSRGCGASLKFGKFQITPFVSFRKLDGKSSGEVDFPFTISQTGYHRTASEIASKQALSYTMTGLHVATLRKHWRYGLAFVQHDFSLDTLFSRIQNADVFYNYFKRQLRLYGELAIDNEFRVATIHGVHYALSEEVSFSCNVRYYQPDYQSFTSSSVGRQSSVENERGINTNMKFTLTERLSCIVANDIFVIPHEWTGIPWPSQGNVLRLRLSYKMFSGLYMYYQAGFTRQTSKTEMGFDMPQKQSHKLYVSLPISSTMVLKTSVQVSVDANNKGVLLYEEFVWKPTPMLAVSARFANFDAPYENRLYAWEDDVMYLFSNSQYFYSGTYNYLVVKWKVTDFVTFQTKVSCTNFSEKYDLPESYDVYENHRRMNMNLLLQIQI